jgi:hypothetical protein
LYRQQLHPLIKACYNRNIPILGLPMDGVICSY